MDRSIEINQLHSEICGMVKMTVEKAIRIGELLGLQKAELPHGEWIPWVKTNLNFEYSQVTRYMNCYRHQSRLSNIGPANISIKELARVYELPGPEEKPENIEKFRDPTVLSDRPPEPTEDEKRFQEARKAQDRTPLSDDYRKRIQESLKASWWFFEQHDGLNGFQLEEAIQMCLDFWLEKQNEVLQKKFRSKVN